MTAQTILDKINNIFTIFQFFQFFIIFKQKKVTEKLKIKRVLHKYQSVDYKKYKHRVNIVANVVQLVLDIIFGPEGSFQSCIVFILKLTKKEKFNHSNFS